MYHHINRDHRVVLATLLRAGYSQSDAAQILGVHRSTICRELQRPQGRNGAYYAIRAENDARRKRKRSKYATRKIENDPILEARIIELLHPLVSPEVVAHEVGLVHETLYAWVARSHPELRVRFPYKGKKRRRYGHKRQEKQGWTKQVRSIDDRPVSKVAWEGDTVKGSTRARLLTHVERTSLFAVVDLIPDGTADVVHHTMLHNHDWSGSTITYDRGSEFALWKMIEEDTGAQVHFAHAHHPWERGKNENTNGRCRRVFPKRFDFATITQRDVDRMVNLMNHTKRKSLSWRTPCEVYGKCCSSD